MRNCVRYTKVNTLLRLPSPFPPIPFLFSIARAKFKTFSIIFLQIFFFQIEGFVPRKNKILFFRPCLRSVISRKVWNKKLRSAVSEWNSFLRVPPLIRAVEEWLSRNRFAWFMALFLVHCERSSCINQHMWILHLRFFLSNAIPASGADFSLASFKIEAPPH